MGQNLCTQLPANTENGAFEIEGNITSGCSPLTIKVKNKSGSNDVHYLFDYLDQTPAQLDWTGNRDSIDVGFANNTIHNYTILQYGKRNGKEFYACKTVVVRPDNKPVFSYNSCNNSNLEINIPIHPLNDFDFYEINWGNGSFEILQANNLPYSNNKNISFPAVIKVNGKYLNQSLNCASSSDITIPFKSPSNFPGGYDDPYKINIDQIKLLTKSIAEIKFHGSLNTLGYSLNFREQPSLVFTEIKKNIQPGIIQVVLPDTSKSYCFKISRFTNCGIDDSPELCTLPLNTIMVSETYNELNWSDYPNTISQNDDILYGRYLIKKQIIKKEEGTVPSLISGINSYQVNYIDSIFDCEKKVCYSIEMETAGQYYYYKFGGRSISNTICIDRKTFHPPSITELGVSLENDSNLLIDFQNNSGWNLPIKKYSLLDGLGSEIAYSNNQTQFKVTPQNSQLNSECFYIGYTDQCNSVSKLSPKICSIVLQFSSEEKLTWNNNIIPFGNSQIDYFQLVNIDEKNNNEIEIQKFHGNSNDYKPDITNFEKLAKFKLIAISSTGKESHSNIVKIPIDPQFFFPDAISLDGNNFNDSFEIKGKLGRVIQNTIEIYNRWGEKIYSGTGKEWKPDGNMPVGAYFYRVIFRLNDNTEQIVSGKLEIIN